MLLFSSMMPDIASKGSSGFARPENFEIIKTYDRSGVSIWGGANDWESSPTCMAVCRTLNKGSQADSGWRMWVQLTPPDGCDDFGYTTDDERENDLTQDEKDKFIRDQGDKFLKLLEKSVRDINDGEIPSSQGRWAEAIVNGPDELLSMVASCGSEAARWKSTDEMKNAKGKQG